MTLKQEIYDDKKNQVIIACRHEMPDRVPILSFVNSLAIGYSGKTIQEAYKNPEVERACFAKVYEDIYFDGTLLFGIGTPLIAFHDILKTETYILSRDNQTMQHQSSTHMTEDEYDEFIKDVPKYLANKVGYRKLAALQQPYPESYEALKAAMEAMKMHMAKIKETSRFAREDVGIPVLASGSASHPLDMFFDFIRGFKETLIDLRRHPQSVMDAANALTPYYEASLPAPNSREEFSCFCIPTHIPAFLGTKQFEKYYWPYFKKLVETVHASGTRLISLCEGSWGAFYDFLNELPKGALIDMVEKDDIFMTKKRIGENVVIGGGMLTSVLKYNNKEECLSYAKRLIDECAPGGGYLFAAEKTLLALEDVNIDNLIAVNEYVHDYGKY